MSYILDALKQSERRRNSQAPAAGPASPTEVPPPPLKPFYRRRLPWILILLLLSLPVGYLAGRFGVNSLGLASAPESPSQAPVPISPDSAPIITKDTAAAEAPLARKPIVISANTPPILVEAPPVVSLNEPVPALPPAFGEQAPASNTDHSPTPPPTPAPTEPEFDPGVPDIRELPASIRSRLPALTLSVHIYSPDPAARMANINGEMLREGQDLGSLHIERITPKGVILRFETHRFHLYSLGG